MGGSEAVLASFVAGTTTGQIAWFYINRIIDNEERERRVHLKCLPKLKETRCEVCGEEVNLLEDYRDWISDKVYSPREYVEHQLTMTEEEQERREMFIAKLFEEDEERRARGDVDD